MRVLLTSHGSTGDIYPLIRLGRALVEAGHEARLATVSLFRAEIEAAGVTYVYLPPDWDRSGFAEAMRDLTKAKSPLDLLRILYSESLPFLEEILSVLDRELEAADCFVCSYLFSGLSSLARRRGVPCAVTTFAHNVVPTPDRPPHGLPRLAVVPAALRRGWNRALWHLADRVLCRRINGVVGETLRRNGLPPVSGFLLEPADRVLVTVSPSLFQPTRLWSDRFRFVGYLRWQSARSEAVEGELNAFCKGERLPVLTFGSVTFDEARKVMTRFMRSWPQDRKIVIQSGWAGLTIERPGGNMLCVDQVSHDQLFRHASMVIHHGGAGTTASVLHAGVPQIIIPHIGDQWFFAHEIKRLGAGVEVRRARWPEELPKAVRSVERSGKMAGRAKALAERLAKEDGPGNAVRELEALAEGREVSRK